MLMSFPSFTVCTLAAFLYGGPDFEDHGLLPVSFPSESCQVDAWLSKGELHIQGTGQLVSVPVPSQNGWYLFKYRWGFDFAYLTKMGENEWYSIPVRMGPVGFY